MMRKQSTLWLSLCLSSLMVAVSLVAGTPINTSARPSQTLAQANPRTSKLSNVGGPLASDLQGKPVVVDMYATWCSACQNIAPIISQLKKDYAGKANFVVLDVSDKAKANQSQRTAQELGLGSFFEKNKSKTGMVVIIEPETGNILVQNHKNADPTAYISVLNSAISQR